MENRRLLLAVFLSMLILMVWYSVFPPVPPPQAPTSPGSLLEGEVDTSTSPAAAGSALDEEEGPGSTDLAGSFEASEDTSLEDASLIAFDGLVVAAELEESQVLENERARVEIDNRGAQLVSFQLKQRSGRDEELLELVRDRGSDPYPFSLVVDGEKSHRLNKALFVAQREDQEGAQVVRFQHRSDRGAAEKVFRLRKDGLFEVEMTVLGDRSWSVVLGPGLRNLDESELDNRFIKRDVGYRRGDTLETIGRTKQDADEFVSARGLRWVTLEDNFFLIAAMPVSGVEEIIVRPVLQRLEYREDRPRFLPLGTEVDAAVTQEQLLLLESSGPRMEIVSLLDAKRYSHLADLPYGLGETVRWGWFGFLAKPLYFALEWIYHEIVPNYGWAIVLVTLLIKLLFFPLTYKSQESMGKMQELNPKVQSIKNKYRSKLKDRQGRPNPEANRQMNEEMMKLYKSAGVNPAMGCLPILLQAPVFFAFFRLLSTAVELRNAAWIGWITDLSAKDPRYVLPLLMGATSVALQRMMPAAPDPMQRRMMQLLPIMFTAFAFQFPSGLVLYWITNNLLSMVQQGITNRLKARREVVA